MVLTDDELWAFVEKMSDGGLKCKFCGQLLAATTSITRFKWHWSGVEGGGVKICVRVTTDIQEAASQAIQQALNKKQKIMPSSSNVNEAIQQAPETVYHMENMTGGMIQSIEENLSPQRFIVDEHDEPRGDAAQVTDKVAQVDLQGANWNDIASIALFMEDDVENGTGGLVEPVAGASSSRGITRNPSETGEDVLPTSSTKLVGRAFEENKNAIWSWLMNDELSSIGIYGMGGVGKTTLVKDIYNQLQEGPYICHNIYWVTVSQNFRIKRLQDLIAKCINLDLSNEDDELLRAFKLSKELKKKQKWILILDDLWNSFEVHEVGIPIQMKGSKLILTTRSEKVCQRMDCQNKIKVKPLSDEEAWALFMEKHGPNIALSPGMKKIALSITKECAGLPLGIITMAGTMKEVEDIHEWRNALEDLKQSRVRQDDMEEEVFRILRFSYIHLNDSALQNCLLYCALFPEDSVIPREDLIGYLIDEGIIKGLKSRVAEFDKGHSMLNKLENACLLESCLYLGHRAVKMHDLIRDMALQIQHQNSRVMIEAGVQLTELPDAVEWTEDLSRVSLMRNKIEEIPSTHSPRCPKLSTLLLFDNELRFIADSFFKQLHGLKILDLSYTNIETLSYTVSDLVSLNALLLNGCGNLRYVPSFKKLTALKRLDLKGTALVNMPQDMEWLTNLRYLRLNGCGQKEFPCGMLSKLSQLQVFVLKELMLDNFNIFKRIYAPVTIKGKEVACLKKLETVECHFERHSDFVEYLKSRGETQSLSTYKIIVGQLDMCDYIRMSKTSRRNKVVWFGNFSIGRGRDFVVFPNDIQQLMMLKCNDARSLCDVSSLKYANELELIVIEECNRMESLLSSSWFYSVPLRCNGAFSGLKILYCYRCVTMKKLFPFVLLPNLVNLEEIKIEWCEKMEEIISTSDEARVMGEESSTNYSISKFSLPKLRTLELFRLPELKSICSAKLICDSLQVIDVWGCPKLRSMPICLPLLDHGQPSPPPSLRRIEIKPKEWWETVEWENSNAKDVLRQVVWFWDPSKCDYSLLDTMHG